MRKASEIIAQRTAQKINTDLGIDTNHRHPNATPTQDGFMPKEDKAAMNARTNEAIPNTIVNRDSNARFKAGTPTEQTHVARKQEVDAVQTNLNTHINNNSVHMTPAEKLQINDHMDNSTIHTSQAEKDAINGHISNNDIHVTKTWKVTVDSHIANQGIHTTQSEKDANAAHIADEGIHVTPTEKSKLAGIQENAEVNQNAFSKVNNIDAGNKTDALTIKGSTGISVTTNPVTKEVTITATGDATPGPHAETHLTGGSDPIPVATTTQDGLMSAADKVVVGQAESHISDTGIHVTPEKKTEWDNKETPSGAQAKADAAQSAAEQHADTVAVQAETNAKNASYPRTGGDLDGDLVLTQGKKIKVKAPTGQNIDAIIHQGGDQNGVGLGVGAGGLTVLGGGESYKAILNDPTLVHANATHSTEDAVVSADGDVNLIAGMQTVGNRKILRYGTNGILTNDGKRVMDENLIRVNAGKLEYYDGSQWKQAGGGGVKYLVNSNTTQDTWTGNISVLAAPDHSGQGQYSRKVMTFYPKGTGTVDLYVRLNNTTSRPMILFSYDADFWGGSTEKTRPVARNLEGEMLSLLDDTVPSGTTLKLGTNDADGSSGKWGSVLYFPTMTANQYTKVTTLNVTKNRPIYICFAHKSPSSGDPFGNLTGIQFKYDVKE